jgi:DNA repair ATPase RecN
LDNTLDKQLEKLNKDLELEKTEINNIQTQVSEIEYSLNETQTKFNTKNIDLAGANSSLASKKSRFQSLNNREIKHACNITEMNSKRQELLDLQNVKQKELEQYKVTKSVSELLDEIDPLKKAIDEDNIIIEKNAIIIKTNSENKAKCAELKITNEKLLDEVVALNNKVSSIKEAYEMVNKTLPKYISKRICDSLQNKINKFIHRVFPKYEVKLEVSDKGCDLLYTKDKTVVDEKRNKYLKADMSSGLERYILSLAFKVSLAESYKLDLFVGDEIDQSANDQDAKILTDMLINSKSFKQLFIISHKNAILDHITENYKCNVYKAEDGKFHKTNFL